MTILTIGIPTFNSSAYLQEALEKILDQSRMLKDVEILICDNASADDTEIVATQFVLAHPEIIRYIRHDSNLGMDRNFWSVIENARGEYVHLHADDDYYAPGGLGRILKTLKTQEFSALLLSNNYLNTHNGKILKVKEEGSEDIFCNGDGEQFFLKESLKTLCLSNIIVKRSRCIEIADITAYFGSQWLHVAILTEIIKPRSTTYIFNFSQPVMTVRLGNQKWLENEGSVAYYYNVLTLFEKLRKHGYSRKVFEHIKLLFLPLIMNGASINFRSFHKNVQYCFKFFRFYYNRPSQYLGFCARLILKKHRKFFDGWEKIEG